MKIKIFKCRGTRSSRQIKLGTSIIADLGLVKCPEDLSRASVFVRRALKKYSKFSEKDLRGLLESCNIFTRHCFLVLNISDKIIQKYIKLRRIDSYIISYRDNGLLSISDIIRPSINPEDSLDDFDDDLYLELSEKGFDVNSEDSEFIGNIELDDILKHFISSEGLVYDIKSKHSYSYTTYAWILKVLNSPSK